MGLTNQQLGPTCSGRRSASPGGFVRAPGLFALRSAFISGRISPWSNGSRRNGPSFASLALADSDAGFASCGHSPQVGVVHPRKALSRSVHSRVSLEPVRGSLPRSARPFLNFFRAEVVELNAGPPRAVTRDRGLSDKTVETPVTLQAHHHGFPAPMSRFPAQILLEISSVASLVAPPAASGSAWIRRSGSTHTCHVSSNPGARTQSAERSARLWRRSVVDPSARPQAANLR
jgi:hypothetical protein